MVSGKEIALSGGRGVTVVDESDYAWLSKWKWRRHPAGYAQRGDGTLMHRLIMRAPKGMQVDHVNTNKLDNRRENLRLATNSQNHMNAPRDGANSSGHKGVVWHKQNSIWQAQIKVGGKCLYLGAFKDKEDAARAYDAAAVKHFGEFARLNFP